MTRPHTGQRCERDADREPAGQAAQAKRSPELMRSQSRHPDESNSPDESNDGWGGDASRSTGAGVAAAKEEPGPRATQAQARRAP